MQVIRQFCYQIPLRFIELIHNQHRPVGLWIFGMVLASNIIALLHILIKVNLITGEHLDGYVQLTVIMVFLLELFLIHKFDDYIRIVKKEQKRGKRFNTRWRLVTWSYIALSIVLIIIAS